MATQTPLNMAESAIFKYMLHEVKEHLEWHLPKKKKPTPFGYEYSPDLTAYDDYLVYDEPKDEGDPDKAQKEFERAVWNEIYSAFTDRYNRKELEGLSLRERVRMGKLIFHTICGLGILEPLLEDEEVSDIMVNRYDRIFYEKNGVKYQYEESFESEERLQTLIQQIVGKVNRSVNELRPIQDARLEDGSRVNVVLPPVSLQGPSLSIRKFRHDPITAQSLVELGSMTPDMTTFLRQLVEERKNIFVCGGTSSGKTTLLNVLSEFIPADERIITIEDSAELRLRGGENLVRMECRPSSAEGKGEISLRDLIRASLRMNPDRIVVGEVRGEEAFDMLSGMNTGHACMSTGHANSCKDMLYRLESMVWMGRNIPLEAVRQMIASALDYLVFVEKTRSGRRWVKEIMAVGSLTNGEIELQSVCRRMDSGEVTWAQEAGAK